VPAGGPETCRASWPGAPPAYGAWADTNPSSRSAPRRRLRHAAVVVRPSKLTFRWVRLQQPQQGCCAMRLPPVDGSRPGRMKASRKSRSKWQPIPAGHEDSVRHAVHRARLRAHGLALRDKAPSGSRGSIPAREVGGDGVDVKMSERRQGRASHTGAGQGRKAGVVRGHRAEARPRARAGRRRRGGGERAAGQRSRRKRHTRKTAGTGRNTRGGEKDGHTRRAREGEGKDREQTGGEKGRQEEGKRKRGKERKKGGEEEKGEEGRKREEGKKGG